MLNGTLRRLRVWRLGYDARSGIDDKLAAIIGAVFAGLGLWLTVVDDDLFDKSPLPKTITIGRSKYVTAVTFALMGLIIELLVNPLIEDLTGRQVKGPLLFLLDALAASSEIVSILVLVGKRIFKTGRLAKAIDWLVDTFGPITSGIEKMFVVASASTTFISIGVHAGRGDYAG